MYTLEDTFLLDLLFKFLSGCAHLFSWTFFFLRKGFQRNKERKSNRSAHLSACVSIFSSFLVLWPVSLCHIFPQCSLEIHSVVFEQSWPPSNQLINQLKKDKPAEHSQSLPACYRVLNHSNPYSI